MSTASGPRCLHLVSRMGDRAPDGDRIEDIEALVTAAISHYRGIDSIPYDQLVTDITSWKLSRRRRR